MINLVYSLSNYREGETMKKIAVLADSGCKLPIGSLEDQGIYIVPLTITMGNKT